MTRVLGEASEARIKTRSGKSLVRVA